MKPCNVTLFVVIVTLVVDYSEILKEKSCHTSGILFRILGVWSKNDSPDSYASEQDKKC